MIVGLILAGGLSSRMGEDKAMLRIDGETLLDRTARALRTAGVDLVALSGKRPGGIPDQWAAAGPVGGIASATLFLPDADLLVVPVDMPCLGDAALLPLLADRTNAVTCWQGHPLPMRLTLDETSRALLADMMLHPGRECSVSALQSRLGTTRLPLDGIDTALLVNCNTPDEWKEANR
jgi:molybdopterin-guanine dinucleotide biosynthesis protein A